MMESVLKIFEDGLFAAIAAIGFSAINATPRRAYAAIGLIAALSHALRYVLMAPWGAGMGLVGADTLAALCAGLCAIPAAPRIKCPAEVCFAPALLPMIPGMYAYRSVEALMACVGGGGEDMFMHNFYLLCYNGFTCVAAVAGMVVAATMPVFLFKRIAFRATR